jgi:hypothetical protein
VQLIAGFRRGKHLSPQVSPDGQTITFVAEPDGVANIYRMAITGGPISQLTSFATGVAGITTTSPALSMASSTGRLAFSVFEHGGAAIYVLDPQDDVALVAPVESVRGALIPPRVQIDGPLENLITDFRRGLPPVSTPVDTTPYSRKLELDAIGQPSVSAGVSSWGAYVGGGVSALFKDVLGDRLLSAGAEVAGTLDDLGGWLTYVNRRHRWNWGLSLEQAPYRAEFVQANSRPEDNTFVATSTIERQLSRGVFGLATFPINQSKRFEFSGGVRHLSFGREERTSTFDLTTGNLIERTHDRLPLGRPLDLAEGSVAFVHDTSFFGAVSPIFGRRYRIELGHSQGTLRYNSLMVDGRQYLMPIRPVTIGMRAMTFGRYGRDADDPLLVPLFLGYPEMVHGYGFGSFSATECPDARTADGAARLCAPLDHLVGSRIAVANLEVRAPIPGLFHGEIDYGRVPMEVVGFFDAGVAWSGGTRPRVAGGTRPLSRSVGAALRVNVLGIFALELAASRPLDRSSKSLRWQLGIRQGF